jgi:replicative DNA helicase
LEAYFERRNSGGIAGIPTGLIPLDMMLGGIKNSDLITVLGFTGTGKTWALAILATLLAKAGYKILFITREMNTDQMMMRIDAIWAGISYGDFSRGKLSPTDEQKLVNYYDTMEANKDANLVVELSTGGVTNCAAMIDKHSPDLVLVDGGYLMTEDDDEDDWKGVMKVWRGFKNIALAKKVPFIVTSQIKEADKVSLGKISFSKALANECDAVIALEQTEEMKEDKEIRWKPLKLRNSDMTSSFMTRWDFSAMNYEPIYVEGGKVNRKVENKDKPQIQKLE